MACVCGTSAPMQPVPRADIARKDAEDANQVKTSFLTSMSHELRTPLNAILGYNELLLMGIKGPVSVDQKAALGGIRVAGIHLLGLINEVLNLARLADPKISSPALAVPLSDVLHKTALMIEPQALAPGDCVHVHAVRADAGRRCRSREAAPDSDQSPLQRHQVH